MTSNDPNVAQIRCTLGECTTEYGEGHGHSHGIGGAHRPQEKKRLIWSLVITFVVMGVEIAGGLYTGSLALISDAGHMFSHVFALGVSLAAIVIASRPASSERTYGYYRAEVLAALLNGVTLVVVAGVIFYEAVGRVLDPQPILGAEMFAVAVIGLIANLATAAILHGVSKDDLNVRGAFVHMLGDALSSVGVILGAIVIWATGWVLIDPLLSVLICVVILVWSWKLMRESVRILMEATPDDLHAGHIAETIKDVCGESCTVRDLHLWTITSGMPVLTAHLELPESRIDRRDDLLDRLQDALHERHGIHHATVQFVKRG